MNPGRICCASLSTNAQVVDEVIPLRFLPSVGTLEGGDDKDSLSKELAYVAVLWY
jgi:hypothetical protein